MSPKRRLAGIDGLEIRKSSRRKLTRSHGFRQHGLGANRQGATPKPSKFALNRAGIHSRPTFLPSCAKHYSGCVVCFNSPTPTCYVARIAEGLTRRIIVLREGLQSERSHIDLRRGQTNLAACSSDGLVCDVMVQNCVTVINSSGSGRGNGQCIAPNLDWKPEGCDDIDSMSFRPAFIQGNSNTPRIYTVCAREGLYPSHMQIDLRHHSTDAEPATESSRLGRNRNKRRTKSYFCRLSSKRLTSYYEPSVAMVRMLDERAERVRPWAIHKPIFSGSVAVGQSLSQ